MIHKLYKTLGKAFVNKPIFLHSGWRTGSTYIWSKFRNNYNTMAFYEPFNEIMSLISEEEINKSSHSSWNSKHPKLEKPYYEEYSTLLNDDGIGLLGFHDNFSYRNFFTNDLLQKDQKTYVDNLINCAMHCNKQPVLGFCRSTGRMDWMTKNYPDALHIAIIRDSIQQWLSGYIQYTQYGNDYFLLVHILIVGLAENCDKELLDLRNKFEIPNLPGNTFKVIEEYRKFVNLLTMDQQYEIFLHIYLITMLKAIRNSNLIIDMDLLSKPSIYRFVVSKKLYIYTGINIDFKDAAIANHQYEDIQINFQCIHEQAWDWFRQRHQMSKKEQHILRKKLFF